MPVTSIQEIAKYNLIVLGNYSATGNVQGPTIICDSYLTNSTANFCTSNGSSTYNVADLYLLVNNNYEGGTTINAAGILKCGSASFGNPPNRTITHIGDEWTINGKYLKLEKTTDGGTITVSSSLNAKCLDLKNVVVELSQQLSQLSMPENTVNISGNYIYFNVYSVDCNGVAIFNLNASFTLCTSSLAFNLMIYTSNVSFIVINTADSNVTQTQNCMSSSNNTLWQDKVAGIDMCQRTLWNMYQATSAVIGNTICGTLLAPNAIVSTVPTLSRSGITVNGGLIVNSISGIWTI